MPSELIEAHFGEDHTGMQPDGQPKSTGLNGGVGQHQPKNENRHEAANQVEWFAQMLNRLKQKVESGMPGDGFSAR